MEENSEKEYTITFGKRERKVNPKKAMYAFNIIFIVALVTIMTYANDLIIDPTHVNWWEWLTRTLILVGIQIPSIILGELMSADRHKEDAEGVYQKALKRMRANLSAIKDTKIYFSQFFFWFKNRENFNVKCDYLMSHEFGGLEAVYIVRYVTREDLIPLSKGPIRKTDGKGREITIRSIPEYKMPYVEQVVSGKLDIADNSYSYYLSADSGKGSSMSILQEGSRISKERTKLRTRNRALKIATFLLFSVVWAMVAVDTGSDIGATQTWLNLVSRLASMVAGLLSGWLTSIIDVKLAARELDVKSEVLEEFQSDLSKGIFKPKSYEELAREEQMEFERKEEEAINAVVTPIAAQEGLLIEGGN